MADLTTNLGQIVNNLFQQGSILRVLAESLLKGGALSGSLALVQQVRGKVRVALIESIIQTVVFAFVLFFIDYILPRFLSTSSEE